MAYHYADVHDWNVAHDAEPRQLEIQVAARWLTKTQLHFTCNPVSNTMTYNDKLNSDILISERKARFSARGDFMRPYKPYNLDLVKAL